MPKDKTTQHTPGPWKAMGPHPWDIEAGTIDASKDDFNGGNSIAHCFGPDRKANTVLVAASPELLEALEMLIDPAERAVESGAYEGHLEIDTAKALLERLRREGV